MSIYWMQNMLKKCCCPFKSAVSACIGHVHDFVDFPPAVVAALYVLRFQHVVLKPQSDSQGTAGGLE